MMEVYTFVDKNLGHQAALASFHLKVVDVLQHTL